MCYKRKQVLLVQVLSPEEIDPVYEGRVHLVDCESDDIADERNLKMRVTSGMLQAYADALNDYKAELQSYCNSRGADFISVSTGQPIEKALFAELLKVGVME